MEDKLTQYYTTTSGGFGAIASSFVIESLQHMITWLIVMTAVIFADLVTGVFKSYRLKQKVRPSRAMRDTISKLVTYFAFVVCACMVGVATEGDGDLEKYCCLFVIMIEGISIGGNILRFNGYDLDFNKTLALFLSKRMDCDKADIEGLIVKVDNKKRKKVRKAEVADDSDNE